MVDQTEWPKQLTGIFATERPPTTLGDAIRRELLKLWRDLDHAIGRAEKSNWSLRCYDLAERIRDLTLFLGPAPWTDVPSLLVASGVYQRLHQEWGCVVEIDPAEFEALRGYWHDVFPNAAWA